MKKFLTICLTILFYSLQANATTDTNLTSFCSNSKEKGATEQTQFSWKDEFYWHVNLDKPLKEYLTENDKANKQIAFGFVIHNQITYLDLKLTEAEMEQTSYVFDILPSPEKATDFFELNAFLALESEVRYYMGKKKHMKAEIFYESDETDSNGDKIKILKNTFSIDLSDFDKDINFQRMSKVQESAVENRAKKTFLPEVFNTSGAFKDPSLSKTNIKRLFETQVKGAKVLKLSIDTAGSDWLVQKDEYDRTSFMSTGKEIGIAYSINGECFFNPAMYLERPYLGGGKYGKLNVPGAAVSHLYIVKIACENIK
ncbi:hypothetical protein ATO12_12655 [Aquimarina atlantica]|uniref:Uncharacterized protein n=1 Tax=Aquimarina atlantica TaxID=1317122 RepID=A0A023BX80_9FLAO|nr:hypothetical protein [Aquimarina atlantica]EZH74610.1 hypothetical protein ATO12_12655 [Aquimarina atlantica]